MSLSVRQLEKVYQSRRGRVQALTPTSFEVGQNEFVSLVGPSGCGNPRCSTCWPDSKNVAADEILLDDAGFRPGADRGMVFQNYTLFPWLTVLQNTRFSFDLEENTDYSRTDGEVDEPRQSASIRCST